MRVFAFISLLFFGTTSWTATTTVLDSQNLLGRVDQFLQAKPFSEALLCDSGSKYDHPVKECSLSCHLDSCMISCQIQQGAKSQKIVADCSDDEVFVYSDRGDIQTISKEAYELQSGNMARFVIDNLGETLYHNTTVQIDKIETTEFKLRRGTPQELSLPAMHIFSSVTVEGSTHQIPFIMTVLRDSPAVAQVARFRFFNETWFLLEDF